MSLHKIRILMNVVKLRARNNNRDSSLLSALKLFAVGICFVGLTTTHAQTLAPLSQGNGGDVIVCPNKQEVELLDIFEYRFAVTYPGERIFEKYPGNYLEKLNAYIASLDYNFPYRALRLRKTVEQFLNNTKFTTDPLPDIPDSKHVILPRGCVTEQIAVQYRDKGESRFEVQQGLWDRSSESTKAELVFHEGFLGEAIDEGHLDSRGARALTGYFALSRFVYNRTVREFQAKWGFPLEAYYKNQKATLLFRPSSSVPADKILQMIDPLSPRGTRTLTNICGYFRADQFIPCGAPTMKAEVEGDNVASLASDKALPLNVLGLKIPVKEVSFQVSRVWLASDYPVVFDGHTYTCSSNSLVSLNPASFTVNDGYSESEPLVFSCLASYAGGDFLPARSTPRLANIGKFYITQFKYDVSSGVPVPMGISYVLTEPKDKSQPNWRLGFSLFDDVTFRVFNETWATNELLLETSGGKFPVGSKSSPCTITDGQLKLKMGPEAPIVMHAKFKDPCVVNSSGARLMAFERNDNGAFVSGEPAVGQKYQFGLNHIEFTGPILFKQNAGANLVVAEGTPLLEQIEGMISVHGEMVSRRLPRNWRYRNVDANIFEIAGNPARDQDGNYRISGETERPQIVTLKTGLTVKEGGKTGDVREMKMMSNILIAPDLTLISGTTAASYDIPVCRYDDEKDVLVVERRVVPQNTRIALWGFRSGQPPKELCFSIK